ncbi:MAG: 2,3,4,5-tetrahydropyridine-2,6-dicarboxylate N-succinyltransferase [Myxococcota bacterium]
MKPNIQEIAQRIDAAFADRTKLDEDTRWCVREAMAMLDRGDLRVCEKTNDTWTVNAWVKRAILLYFAVSEMQVMEAPPFEYFDKIPLKKNLREQNVRVVPPGVVRYGAHCEAGVVVMPAYVNIGAYVGAGTMVDTWATVGSCAQIGKHVHLSGGVGIGGVLEPPQASPVIVEDGAFIGSRCIVVEGVQIGEGAVLGAGVVLTASTPIIDVTGSAEVIVKGRVPPRSVVVPGTRPRKFAAGEYNLPCALIIGQRNASTDLKTSLNDALRDFAVAA